MNPQAATIGTGAHIADGWVLAGIPKNGKPGSIRIGSNCAINHDFQCNAAECVSIGDNVLIAPRVFITDCDHIVDATASTTSRSDFRAAPVDCWLGVGAIILKGVHLGHHCIVGAGAVVTKSFSPYSIVVGNPAKCIEKRLPLLLCSACAKGSDDFFARVNLRPLGTPILCEAWGKIDPLTQTFSPYSDDLVRREYRQIKSKFDAVPIEL